MAVLRGTSLWNGFPQSQGMHNPVSFPQAGLAWRNSPCLDSEIQVSDSQGRAEVGGRDSTPWLPGACGFSCLCLSCCSVIWGKSPNAMVSLGPNVCQLSFSKVSFQVYLKRICATQNPAPLPPHRQQVLSICKRVFRSLE